MRVSGKIIGMTHNTYKSDPATRRPQQKCGMRVSGNISEMTHNTYQISPKSHNGKFRDASCATEFCANNKYQAPITWIAGCGMRNEIIFAISRYETASPQV